MVDSSCLEIQHFTLNGFNLFQFYKEAPEVEKWIAQMTNALNTYYNRSQLSLDEGEKLIREIQVLPYILVSECCSLHKR